MNKLGCAVGIAVTLACVPSWAGTATESLRDPTRPLSYTVVQSAGPQLVLQAILQRHNGRQAVVNGQSVIVGSTIDGARIEQINRQSLVYSYQGQRQTLSLRPHVR